jgi:hypothetical protein
MWSTTASEKATLRRAIESYRRPRVLEIGAFKGETTRVLSSAAGERGGYVVVVDPMRWGAEVEANGLRRHHRAWGMLARGLERLVGRASYEPAFWANVGSDAGHVRLYRSRSGSAELLANTAADLRAFDVVFIDGDHSYEGAAADLAHWGTRTAPGGTIYVHDAVPRFPGVIRALAEVAVARGLEVVYPREGSLASIHVPTESHRGASRVGSRVDDGG